MTKEEIIYKIEQIAHNGAFDGINAKYVEREAEKLADKIIKSFVSDSYSECCKYVKRVGESCILNNNCKYPQCK